ncbi:MAG: hypothetical protein BWK76_08250 [Desulfobulbaceae bacterium A2]|nr:MAG: hypothetical protein BWK76_08250 [Desulfobulbaceae bacterium A2]
MHKRDIELIRAVQRGDVRGVAKSLRAGASPNASTGPYPVLVAAILNGETAVAQLLIEHGAATMAGGPYYYQRPLLAAVKRGDATIVELLLHKGADPTWTRPGYASALELAATQGQAEVVVRLLAGGVDPLAQDALGQTALHLAASAGHADVARVLIDAGVAVDVETAQGMTPLACAVAIDPDDELEPIRPEARHRVVAMLISRGADVSHRDRTGRSIGDHALERQDVTLMELLSSATENSPPSPQSQ